VITSAGGRQLSEQQRAAQQLRALAKPYRFRVLADTEGFPIIPGRYGQIEWFGSSGPSRMSSGHQTGDSEMRAVFPPEALEQVAGVIRAPRKPGIGSEVAKKIGARTAFERTSRLQEDRFEPSKGLGFDAGAATRERGPEVNISAGPGAGAASEGGFKTHTGRDCEAPEAARHGHGEQQPGRVDQ